MNAASAKGSPTASKFLNNVVFQKNDVQELEKFLTELPSNDDGNKKIVSFSEAMNKDLSNEERVKNLTEDKNEIFACVDGEGKIQLVHSISNLGGTKARSNSTILDIIGMDNQGICVKLVESLMVSYCLFNAPSSSAVLHLM